LESAGGSVLSADSQHVSLGPPAVQALSIMKRLATSPAAGPSLPVQMEDANRLAMCPPGGSQLGTGASCSWVTVLTCFAHVFRADDVR
jgi:hypothetical protein